MTSRPALLCASPLSLRFLMLCRRLAAALGIAGLGAIELGCALSVGIEDVSGSPTDDFSQRCVDKANAFRILHNLGTIERWLEIEPCAAMAAEVRAHSEPPFPSVACRPDACSRMGSSMDEILTECLSDEDVLRVGDASTKLACASYRDDEGAGVVLFFYE
jgi:hypothetical protein